MKKDLGIIIVNWKGKKEILACLKSIETTGYTNNIVIVDNEPKKNSELSAKGRSSFGRKIIRNEENLGYAEGNNIGIRFLLKRGIRYILILNPDTVIEKDAINKLIKVLESNETIGIVGPKIYSQAVRSLDFARDDRRINRDNKRKIWSCGGMIDKWRYSGGLIGLSEKDRGQYDKLQEVDYISGTAMLVKREVFEKTGLFYGKYFGYYEDVELCLKAKKSGFRVIFVPGAVIYHNESSSFGKDSPIHSYYMARNHLLFTERNAPFFIKSRELIRLPKTIWEHWRKKEKFALLGIRDYMLRNFGKRDY